MRDGHALQAVQAIERDRLVEQQAERHVDDAREKRVAAAERRQRFDEIYAGALQMFLKLTSRQCRYFCRKPKPKPKCKFSSRIFIHDIKIPTRRPVIEAKSGKLVPRSRPRLSALTGIICPAISTKNYNAIFK